MQDKWEEHTSAAIKPAYIRYIEKVSSKLDARPARRPSLKVVNARNNTLHESILSTFATLERNFGRPLEVLQTV